MYSIMQTQKASGMITLNQSLVELVEQGVITEAVALETTDNQTELNQLLSRIQRRSKLKSM